MSVPLSWINPTPIPFAVVAPAKARVCQTLNAVLGRRPQRADDGGPA